MSKSGTHTFHVDQFIDGESQTTTVHGVARVQQNPNTGFFTLADNEGNVIGAFGQVVAVRRGARECGCVNR